MVGMAGYGPLVSRAEKGPYHPHRGKTHPEGTAGLHHVVGQLEQKPAAGAVADAEEQALVDAELGQGLAEQRSKVLCAERLKIRRRAPPAAGARTTYRSAAGWSFANICAMTRSFSLVA